jgi:hypothetical protein
MMHSKLMVELDGDYIVVTLMGARPPPRAGTKLVIDYLNNAVANPPPLRSLIAALNLTPVASRNCGGS